MYSELLASLFLSSDFCVLLKIIKYPSVLSSTVFIVLSCLVVIYFGFAFSFLIHLECFLCGLQSVLRDLK